jgi:predicted RNA-binding protein with PIN domain
MAIAGAAAAARQLGIALAAASEALGGESARERPERGVPPESEWRGRGDGGSATSEWHQLSGGQADSERGGQPAPDVGDLRTESRDSVPSRSSTGSRGPRPETAGRRRGWPRRQAAPLPPAVFEDSATAAEHLLRIPGMVLLVDGYNVTLAAWPGTAIPEQRRRLVDALSGLAARTGAEIQVVFDGAEQVEHRPRGLPPRSAVRVRFSPPDVDADDVLIDLCEVLPIGRPVTVATSDRRVQDEVRKRGGNVISTPQLLGVIAGR